MNKGWEADYLILDSAHTFLASSLQEEAILFGIAQPGELAQETAAIFQQFKPDFAFDQSINKLSGGENATLAVIFYSCLSRHLHKKSRILMHNIIESLSQNYRDKLKNCLGQFQESGISYYLQNKRGGIEPYV